jgi:dTDP-glucose 4,6-dehydratase
MNLINGKKLPIYGNGSNVREWIHVNDHCRGLELIIKNGTPGEIYNIGTGMEISNLNLAMKLAKIFNFDEKCFSFVEDRLGHDKRYSLDFTKARVNLGYKPVVPFEEGLLATIDWYNKNHKII